MLSGRKSIGFFFKGGFSTFSSPFGDRRVLMGGGGGGGDVRSDSTCGSWL